MLVIGDIGNHKRLNARVAGLGGIHNEDDVQHEDELTNQI